MSFPNINIKVFLCICLVLMVLSEDFITPAAVSISACIRKQPITWFGKIRRLPEDSSLVLPISGGHCCCLVRRS